MPQAHTRETKILREPGQIKVNLNHSRNLQEASHTPEANQEAMSNPEVVAATRTVQEIRREADPEQEMTGPNLETDMRTRLRAVTDVASQIMSSKTVISRTEHA